MGRADGPYRELAEPRSLAKYDARFSDPSLTAAANEQQVHVITLSKSELSRYRRWRRRRLIVRLFYVTYVSSVLIGCASFIYWGCLCHDPEHGNANQWNQLPAVQSSPHECSSAMSISRDWGASWCIAFGVIFALHLFITLPVTIWIARMYSIALAVRTALEGLVVGVGLLLLFTLGVTDQDPPPGFGAHGIPLGASWVSGLLAWLLVMSSAYVGYYRNIRLGAVLVFTTAYVIASTGAGVLVAFHRHLILGFAVGADLLFVLAWAYQAYVTTNSYLIGVQACAAPLSFASPSHLPRRELRSPHTRPRELSLAAHARVLLWHALPPRYVAPLVVGVLLGFPLEAFGLGMPPNAGLAIGCAAIFVASVLLSTAFEMRGIAGARRFALLLCFQVRLSHDRSRSIAIDRD